MRRLMMLVMVASCAFAQDETVFRTGVSLVHVDAEVTAADGRILNLLGRGDFRVFDEGKEQPVLHFASVEEPLDLILLFDVSGSMRAVVERVSEAAKEGFRELHRGDRVSVMTFNTRTRVAMPFTEDLDEVERAIRDDVLAGRFGGGTFIQSAVDDCAERLLREKRTGRRRAVLIITDNIGTRTRRQSTVVRKLWEADAIVTGLVVRNRKFEVMRMASPFSGMLQAGVKGIAEKTGGDFIRSEDPGTAFTEAMRRIRSRYSLYYALPGGKPGSVRRIRVELARAAVEEHPDAKVRARTGYVIPRGATGVRPAAAEP